TQKRNQVLVEDAEAYEILLKLNLGLLSAKTGETNIKGQFQDAWKCFKATSPEKSLPFDRLIQHVTGDSRLIRHHVLDGWRMRDRKLCARDLSDMRHGDTALIIGHVSPNGNISSVTDSIARKLTNNPSRAAK